MHNKKINIQLNFLGMTKNYESIEKKWFDIFEIYLYIFIFHM